MNLKILAVALSMVAAKTIREINPTIDPAIVSRINYEKMPVERQRRFWVSQTRLFYSIV